ncbi:putative rnase3 domain-containing protein [Erysiphe necator]|uniref:Putative rnase3 domain-containing protein n=1 Tax=Uncinula necator TaxID=52586 RepID=A0A0B1P8H1_UNCNE|nr:putative rnase3 domain-containing protein [Erysiphe necator]
MRIFQQRPHFNPRRRKITYFVAPSRHKDNLAVPTAKFTKSVIFRRCLSKQENESIIKSLDLEPNINKFNKSSLMDPTLLDSYKKTGFHSKDSTNVINKPSDGDETTSLVKPRSYQIEMFEECQKKNIIIAMDTGSGKTHIAVMKIKFELDRMPRNKIIWFLTPTVSLCFQQYNYIQSQIRSSEIKILSSSDNVDRWTEQTVWDSVLKNVEIVVSPYQILLDALTHGFVKFDSLALLVLDEAHNCIKKSPGARIMNSFYHPQKSQGLYVPQILGLTASPVMGSNPDSLIKIENTLDCLSRTPTKTRIDLRKRVKLPALIPVKYDENCNEYSSNSFLELKRAIEGLNLEDDPYYVSLVDRNDSKSQRKFEKLILTQKSWCGDHLRSILNISRKIYFELGPWAVDYYISKVISQASKMAKESQELNGIWEETLENIEKHYIAKVLCGVQVANPIANTFNGVPRVSDKVSKLIEILLEQEKGFSGIVFVQERAVVSCLASLLENHPQCRGILQVGKFVGTSVFSRRFTSNFDLIDTDSQNNALHDFRDGKTNLLIGTSVLEEGIDIPTCNLVLCFQKPANLKSYIQRRGRARQRESKLYLLLNSDKNQLNKFEQLELEMRALYEDETRTLQKIPLEEESSDDMKIYNQKQLQIEKTGAILDLDNAVSHLYHFCATIPCDKYIDTRPEFITHKENGLYYVKIVLPISVHEKIRTAKSSHAWKSEKNAIRDAAFEAYVTLYNAGLISDNLLPLMRHSPWDNSVIEKRPSMIKVQELINPWLDIAKIWSRNPKFIYRSTVKFDGLEFYIYLPVKLPAIRDLKVYWDKDTELIITIDSLSIEVGTNPEMLSWLNDESSALINSAFPLERGQSDEMVIRFSANQEKSLKSQIGCQKVPENIGNLRNIGIIRDHQNTGYLFKEILPRKPDAKDVQKANSEFMSAPIDVPYLSLSRISRRRDYMHPVINDTQKVSSALYSTVLPITKCRMDILPFNFVQFALMIPSIVRNLELHLIANNICENLICGTHISNMNLLVSAICSGSACEISNYQRLEFLGDNILKLCASVQIMAENPLWHEGQLSNRKDHLVANSRLARAAIDLGIDKFIVTKSFTGLKWHPTYINGILNTKDEEQRELSSKVLADVVESLLGVTMLDGGFPKVITCLNKFLPELNWKSLDENHHSIIEQAIQLDLPYQPKISKNLEMIEDILDYKFNKKSLMIEALTHASDQSGSRSFERLEFIGDAILDYVIVQEIYSYDLSHIRMHELRTAFVNADLLAFLCFELHANRKVFDIRLASEDSKNTDSIRCEESLHQVHLYCFMRHNSYAISQVQKYTNERFKDLRDEILNALENGGEYPWKALCGLKAEKFYSDMIESLLAAVWVDSGSLNAVVNVVEHIGILKFLRRAILENVNMEHPKITLGKLADNETVSYKFHLNSDMEKKPDMVCTVFVGNLQVACVCGNLSKLELQTRGAVEAIKNYKGILEERKRSTLEHDKHLEIEETDN